MKSILVAAAILMLFGHAFAQDTTSKRPIPDTTVNVYQQVVGKDTFIEYDLGQPTQNELGADYLKKDSEWRKYKQDVNKSLTYAIACKNIVNEMNAHLEQMDGRRERRKYTNEQLDKLKSQFTDKLKDLEYNQGILLVKLISRETGMTTYDIIKDVKNGWSAFWWQKFAKTLYKADLKEVYDRTDPKNAKIELALKEIGYQN